MRLCGIAGVGCEVSEGKKIIQTYPCGAAYTCNIAHISYVYILSAYVVCIFYLLFGVLVTLVVFPYSICKLEIVHILSPDLLLYIKLIINIH